MGEFCLIMNLITGGTYKWVVVLVEVRIFDSSKGSSIMAKSKYLLRMAGGFSFAVAVFQAVICFVPSWSLYFGAPEELVSNPVILIIAGLLMAIVFVVFGLYALAGTGDIRVLPLLRLGLLATGSVYTLRGLLLIPQLLAMNGLLQLDEFTSPQMLASSVTSLFIGLLYLAGTISGWNNLPVKADFSVVVE